MPADPAELSPLTLRAYGYLPQMFRDADEAIAGRPLLTYFATILEPVADLDALVDRFAYVAEDEDRLAGRRTSDLIDPETGDFDWLPWQALIYGARLDRSLPEATQRAQVIDARSGWRRGTRDSIVAAARTQLAGTQSCTVIPHLGGDPWVIGIQTLAAEQLGTDADVIAAVDAADCRPAGHGLQVTHYVSSWDAQEAAYPTWTAREAAGSWDVIEHVGAP